MPERKTREKLGVSLTEMIQNAFMESAEKMAEEGLSCDEINAKLLSNGELVVKDLADQASKDVLTYMKAHMFEAAFFHDMDTNEFLAHHNQLWGECFAASKTMYSMAIEAAQIHIEHIENDVEKEEMVKCQYRFLSLVNLHARACQMFLEILELNKGGFADGAFARWRSMFELCCIAQFISDHDEVIAKQYFEQSETDKQKYEWTVGVCNKNGKPIGKMTFNMIMEMCDINNAWKEEYKTGCIEVHATAQGTFKRMGAYKEIGKLIAGRSDYGITASATHSALSLRWITCLLLSVFPTVDSNTFSKVIIDWSKYLGELYVNAEAESFDDSIDDTKEQTECLQ